MKVCRWHTPRAIWKCAASTPAAVMLREATAMYTTIHKKPSLAPFTVGLPRTGQPGPRQRNLLMMGADYHLSKRTFLYVSLSGISNSAQANYAADVSVGGPGKGASQRVMYAGMSHSF